ncbi:hypothetical protein AVA65_07870 [Salmonella enterica subsp. enterica serovar Minnesota]|nr:hypothetical protein [Salmonella enterica subsp. enterica serovar Minnesota]
MITLTRNGQKFEMITEKKAFMIADKPVRGSLSYNDQLLCHIPCIVETDAIKTLVLAYKMMKCGVVGYDRTLGWDVLEDFRMAVQKFTKNDIYLQAWMEDEDENSYRKFYKLPFSNGLLSVETVLDGRKYSVRQECSPTSNQMYCVKLVFCPHSIYPLQPGYVEQIIEARMWYSDSRILPNAEQMVAQFIKARKYPHPEFEAEPV